MIDTKPTILLVDDEAAITDNLAPFLSRFGFNVVVARDGQATLETLVTTRPDLIVLDVMMPRVDGREVLRRLRQDDNWLPVILLTQVGESFERAMVLQEGADDYLNKPFDPRELVARIRTVLRRAKPGPPPLATAQNLRSGALRLDRVARRAWLNNRELTLTPKAITLLEYLVTQQQAADDRRRFMQRLDHELKNPLMAIRAGAANVGNGSDGGGQDAAISSVIAQTTRLSRLSADLRKLTDLETRPIEHDPIDMAALLREVIDVAGERPDAEQRRIALSLPAGRYYIVVTHASRSRTLANRPFQLNLDVQISNQ